MNKEISELLVLVALQVLHRNLNYRTDMEGKLQTLIRKMEEESKTPVQISDGKLNHLG